MYNKTNTVKRGTSGNAKKNSMRQGVSANPNNHSLAANNAGLNNFMAQ
jgi:hypothetical protein